jgi:hypothetical protein
MGKMSQINSPQPQQNDQKALSFSTIAPEMRNKVYELLLHEGKEIPINSAHYVSPVQELKILGSLNRAIRI